MKDTRKDILWRVYLVYFGVLIFGLAIIAKAYYIQFADGDELKAISRKQEIKAFVVESSRGNILAEDGSLLAISIPLYEVRMDLDKELIPDEIFNDKVDSLALCLSNLFEDRSKVGYKNALQQARSGEEHFFLIHTRVTYDQLKEMKKFPIFRRGKYKGGLITIEGTSRDMPYDPLARRTIGFINKTQDSVGLEGAYAKVLEGKDGQQLRRRINQGEWMPLFDQNEINPENGKDILTTIDIYIQDVAEQALMKALTENQAFQGCVVLMEVATGEIRAIANLRYNPDNGQYEEIYNYAIGECIEPGSTFKLASMIASLEEQPNLDLNRIIDTQHGKKTYSGRVMEDVHVMNNGFITIREAFEQSSNVGISTVVTNIFQYHPERYVNHLRNMSLGKPLGIEISGEGVPKINDPSKASWSGPSLAWMSIGYESQLSPLQILSLYNAVANNGVMVKPMFVKEIRLTGVTLKRFEPQVINPAICSPKTLATVRSLLEGVVERGTGTALKSSTYKVAGKTGTALIADGKRGYSDKNYNGTFVGYFPADHPKYSCIVVISKPKGKFYYGGRISGPVFKEIADKVYATRLDIQSDNDSLQRVPRQVPYKAKGDYEELKASLTGMGYRVEASKALPEWAVVSDSLSAKLTPAMVIKGRIPDVTGMPAKDAIYLLESQGFRALISGKGVVREQSVSPDSLITQGCEVVLSLSVKPIEVEEAK
jgi:cell division protein FtsI (penicillin-binding protein 3)